MKILVACYSWQGHTWKVAKKLAENLDADLMQIESVKEDSMIMKAIKALFNMKSDIKPCKTDLSDVDHLIVATPVWVRHAPPYINKYLSLLTNTNGTSFSVVAEMGSKGADIVIENISKVLHKKGMELIITGITLEEEVENGKYEETVNKMADYLKSKYKQKK
jgi:flavodoxin